MIYSEPALKTISPEMIAQTRRKVWSCVTTVLAELESRPLSELEAVDFFVSSLKAEGLSNLWYATGSASGSKDIYAGTIVVFDNPSDPCRLTFASARSLRPDPAYRWKGLGYFYASPLLGLQSEAPGHDVRAADFGVTIYTGSAPSIKDAFRTQARLTEDVLDHRSENSSRTTGDMFLSYESFARKLHVRNVARSTTSLSTIGNDVNIGHSLHSMSLGERIANDEIYERYSRSRRFIRAGGMEEIGGEIWTFESRDVPSGGSLAVSFHEAFCGCEGRFTRLSSSIECSNEVVMPWLRL